MRAALRTLRFLPLKQLMETMASGSPLAASSAGSFRFERPGVPRSSLSQAFLTAAASGGTMILQPHEQTEANEHSRSDDNERQHVGPPRQRDATRCGVS